MEKRIIKAVILSKENFSKIEKFSLFEDLSDLAKILYSLIKDFYTKDPLATKIDVELLSSQLKRKFPKQAPLFTQFLDTLPDVESSTNLLDDIISIKKEGLGRQISSKLLGGHSDKELLEAMRRYMDIENTIIILQEDASDTVIAPNIKELFSSISVANKIRLWPKALNAMCGGGALRGHTILVFGRPEIGKSLFTINLAGGFIYDGYKVLFIENEDPLESTVGRFICRLVEKPILDIESDPEAAQKVCEAKNYQNLIIKSLAPGTFGEIQDLVTKHSPDVVIINQLQNINIGKMGDNPVQQRDLVAKRARFLAKKNNIVVVGVTQAGASAQRKLVLEMEDIDYSNTGMPAQMDLIIGIGSNDDFTAQRKRMISLPKNKLGGNHGFFQVFIDEKINKVIS